MSATRRAFYFCSTCNSPMIKKPASGLCRPCCSKAHSQKLLRSMTRSCSIAGCESNIRDDNKTGLCRMHVKMRCHNRDHASVHDEHEAESWRPDPTFPERVCQNCGKTFTPASRFNKYFCSPVCRDRANAQLGYAYRMDQACGTTPKRRIEVRGGGV